MFCAIYVPDFIAATIIRAEPELRGLPVAVLEGTPPLLRVCGLNESARLAGVELGMTRVEAETLPDLLLRRRSFAQEAAAHAALLDCAHAFSPRVEPLAPDTVLLDATGLDRLFGPAPKLARDLAHRASELGFEANIAFAGNREAAVHAARGFAGITFLAPGEEARRLGPLAVDVLFSGPDASVEITTGETPVRTAKSKRETLSSADRAQQLLQALDRWGVHNLRSFAALPTIAVAERLGQEGVRLQKLARGEGSQSLLACDPPLCFEEAVELEHPVDLLEPLAFIFSRLLEQLCARLGGRALATNELRLRLTLDSSIREEETEPLPPRHSPDDFRKQQNGNDTASPRPETFSRTLRLPVPMLDAKIFLKLLQLDLNQHPPGAPIVKVELAAEPVPPQVAQHGLFQAATPAPERLQLMLARLAGVVGEGSAGSASSLDTHRRDAFAIRTFVHSAEEEKKTKRSANARESIPQENPKMSATVPVSSPMTVAAENSAAVKLALRIFRPPLAATVIVDDNRPARVSCATAGGERKIAGDVEWACGPWRSTGDWWKELPQPGAQTSIDTASLATRYARDEWDVAITMANNSVLCRLVHDLERDRWMVEGTYD